MRDSRREEGGEGENGEERGKADLIVREELIRSKLEGEKKGIL